MWESHPSYLHQRTSNHLPSTYLTFFLAVGGPQGGSGSPQNPPDFPGWNPDGLNETDSGHTLLITPVLHHPSCHMQMFLINTRKESDYRPQLANRPIEIPALPLLLFLPSLQILLVLQQLLPLLLKLVQLLLTNTHYYVLLFKVSLG